MAKILIVDDDPDMVEACSFFLQKAGYEVVSGSNRAEGMAQARSAKPDLIILDVMMENPDDGIVMAQDLRREGIKTPILMLTSVSRVMGLTYGKDDQMVPVDAFLDKPVKPEALVGQVQKMLKA